MVLLARSAQPPRHRSRHRIATGVVLAFVGLLEVATGCGTAATVRSSGPALPAKATSMATKSTVPVTTIPRHSSPPVTTAPTDCRSGTLSLAASSATSTQPLCLHSGTILTVTFDKSAGSWGGTPGAWTYPPVAIGGDPSILKLNSESTSGDHIIAVFEARSPGATFVTARFEVSCSSRDTSPCTIPPEGEINLDVTVVAP
jgi:hypothetical protein